MRRDPGLAPAAAVVIGLVCIGLLLGVAFTLLVLR